MHMKGRRHRLQYKKKVDPSLQVDLKPIYGRRAKDEREMKQQEEMRRRYVEDKWRMEWEQLHYEEAATAFPHRYPHAPFLPSGGPSHIPPPFGSTPAPPFPMPSPRRPDSYTDRHVLSKHAAIYPSEDELNSVQMVVAAVEQAMKLVADSLAERTSRDNKEEVLTEKESTEAIGEDQVIRSVIRVGALAKGLLLHGDLNLQLVALCSEKPTRTLLDTVVDRLTKQLQILAADEYDVRPCVEEAGLIVVRHAEPTVTCRITLTSPIIRDPMLAVAPG